MKVKIFKPAKTAMQSGLANTKLWRVEVIEEENNRSVDGFTGWVSSDTTQTQLKFKFKTKEDAIKYVESQGFEYVVIEPQTATIKKKSYADNFTN
ncbi:MAG: ETC complex I subunit [Proteobacteria bacterium]|nr:ETC complex I subunit [Pseudomonadota bacterium]